MSFFEEFELDTETPETPDLDIGGGFDFDNTSQVGEPTPGQTPERTPEQTPENVAVVAVPKKVIKYQKNVAAVEKFVEKSDAVSNSLLTASESPQSLAKIKEMLSWEPPNILDKQKYPDIIPILKNPITKPFIYAISKAVIKMAANMAGIVVARRALDACLKVATGPGTQYNEKMADIGIAINRTVTGFAQQTGQVEVALAKAAKEAGAISYVLDYGGDLDDLLNGLEDATKALVKQDSLFKNKMNAAIAQIENAQKWIMQNSMNEKIEEQFATTKKQLQEEEVKISQFSASVAEKSHQWHTKNADLNAEIYSMKDEQKSMVKQMDLTEKEIEKNVEAQKKLDEIIDGYDKRKSDLEDDKKVDFQQQAKYEQQLREQLNEVNKATYDDVGKREKLIHDRIKKLDENLMQLEQLERTADSGGTTTTSSNRYGYRYWWWYWGDYNHTSTTTKPNKKAEFTKIISNKRNEKKELQAQLDKLHHTKNKQQSTLKAQQSELNSALSENRQSNENRFEKMRKHYKIMQEQTKTRKSDLKGRQKEIQLELDALHKKSKANEKLLQNAQGTLKSHNAEPKTAIDKMSEKLEIDRQELSDKQQKVRSQLKKIRDGFGATCCDLLPMIRAMEQMRLHSQNLATNITLLTDSFQAVEETFKGDSFIKRIRALKNADSKRAAIKKLTDEYQHTCLIGQGALSTPIRALVQNDVKALMGPKKSSNPGPIIEEIDDQKEY